MPLIIHDDISLRCLNWNSHGRRVILSGRHEPNTGDAVLQARRGPNYLQRYNEFVMRLCCAFQSSFKIKSERISIAQRRGRQLQLSQLVLSEASSSEFQFDTFAALEGSRLSLKRKLRNLNSKENVTGSSACAPEELWGRSHVKRTRPFPRPLWSCINFREKRQHISIIRYSPRLHLVDTV
jgi:hypothetical protein